MTTKASKEKQGSAVQKGRKLKVGKKTLRDLTPKDGGDAVRAGANKTQTCYGCL
jgi:hypothetical protein